MILQLLNLCFTVNDFEVVEAQNGYEAFEEVEKSFFEDEKGNHSNLFDLIVLDLNMPISDGFEACKNIMKLYQEKSSMYLNLRVPEMNSIEDGQVSFAKSSSSVLKKSNLSK